MPKYIETNGDDDPLAPFNAAFDEADQLDPTQKDTFLSVDPNDLLQRPAETIIAAMVKIDPSPLDPIELERLKNGEPMTAAVMSVERFTELTKWAQDNIQNLTPFKYSFHHGVLAALMWLFQDAPCPNMIDLNQSLNDIEGEDEA